VTLKLHETFVIKVVAAVVIAKSAIQGSPPPLGHSTVALSWYVFSVSDFVCWSANPTESGAMAATSASAYFNNRLFPGFLIMAISPSVR